MIGLLHPGAMGSVVGGCLVSAGHEVAWAGAGRSGASRDRAESAALADLGTIERVRDECDVILSICPPHGALDLARSLAGFTGVYVDANALSPALKLSVGAAVTEGGARFVDGGIVGYPPTQAGTTRLYLAGEQAEAIAALFDGTVLGAVALVGAAPGAAAALKMAYSAWSKGTSALLLAVRGVARGAGVEDALLAEWELSQPGAVARSDKALELAQERGWRWAFELDEVGRTFEAAGEPGGFGYGAAELFVRYERPAD
jgi:3-hydroxyisobutyrate dehydrogenase-like beta-hydroxyacid dehydrogenase